uniref:Ribonucleotide reductase M1 polypeptide n=1 Tax=Eptatretus burgeri TaxID=7764 RepID=A0A8C4QXA5_EPTBU
FPACLSPAWLPREGKGRRVVKAQQLWYAIIESQTETGTPYMLYKDACNRKSNQQNLGTIHCSNLCTEIMEYTSTDEVAVCNLASIALNMYVKADRTYDFHRLFEVTKVIVQNLNKIIDINYYPIPEFYFINMLDFEPLEFPDSPYDKFENCPFHFPFALKVLNPHLLKDLTDRGLWSEEMKNQLIAHNGSVQALEDVPDDLKNLYKTVWEISQRTIISMAADRGAFIDQSQSLNIHVAEPNYGKLTSMHFYGWKQGLKTGMYYLRTKPAANPIKFTLQKEELQEKQRADMVCSLENREACASCSA